MHKSYCLLVYSLATKGVEAKHPHPNPLPQGRGGLLQSSVYSGENCISLIACSSIPWQRKVLKLNTLTPTLTLKGEGGLLQSSLYSGENCISLIACSSIPWQRKVLKLNTLTPTLSLEGRGGLLQSSVYSGENCISLIACSSIPWQRKVLKLNTLTPTLSLKGEGVFAIVCVFWRELHKPPNEFDCIGSVSRRGQGSSKMEDVSSWSSLMNSRKYSSSQQSSQLWHIQK